MNQQCKVPFNPLEAVRLFAETVKTYRASRVTLDRFAHNTFSAAFAQHGVSAVLSDLTTHQTYEAFGPRLNSGQVVLLDHSDLQNQFLGLVWRGARIDHAGNEHDDFSAAVARLVNALQVRTINTKGIILCGERRTAGGPDGYGWRGRSDW